MAARGYAKTCKWGINEECWYHLSLPFSSTRTVISFFLPIVAAWICWIANLVVLHLLDLLYLDSPKQAVSRNHHFGTDAQTMDDESDEYIFDHICFFLEYKSEQNLSFNFHPDNIAAGHHKPDAVIVTRWTSVVKRCFFFLGHWRFH